MPLLKIPSQDQFLLRVAIKPHFQTSQSRQKRGKNMKLWGVGLIRRRFFCSLLSAPSKDLCVLLVHFKAISPRSAWIDIAGLGWTTKFGTEAEGASVDAGAGVRLCTKHPKPLSTEHPKPTAAAVGKSELSYKCTTWKMSEARWKPQRFSLASLESRVAIVCPELGEQERESNTLLYFIYLLLFPHLAPLPLVIHNVPATWKSKGAESRGTKQHLAEWNVSSGS